MSTFRPKTWKTLGVAVVAGAGLSACATDGYYGGHYGGYYGERGGY